MSSNLNRRPPALATWLLQRAARGNDALVGDLIEEYRHGRSVLWYWKQVLTTIVTGTARPALIGLATVALFMVGGQFVIPGAHADTFTLIQTGAAGSPFEAFNVITGGQLAGVTVFALGIAPYVSAAFIVQAIALIWRVVKRNTKSRWDVPVVPVTWCLAIVLCATQAVGLAVFLERQSSGGLPLVGNPGWLFRTTTLLTLTAGTTVLMLISDQISKRRIGNGMLLVFMAGVSAGLLGSLMPLLSGQMDPFGIARAMAINTVVVGVVSYGYRGEIERRALTSG